jgi:hypothetical protein
MGPRRRTDPLNEVAPASRTSATPESKLETGGGREVLARERHESGRMHPCLVARYLYNRDEYE